MRTLKVSGSRETVGRSSISMIGYGWLWRYEGEARRWGECDRPGYVELKLNVLFPESYT
jgi:hypothetical protein